MEQEQLVNRLQRQLSQLLTQQQATEAAQPSTFSLPSSPVTRDLPLDAPSHLGHRARVGSASAPFVHSPPLGGTQSFSTSFPPPANLSALLHQSDSAGGAGGHDDPDLANTLLRVLQSENTDLKTRLADAQNDASRQSRISESYRSELLLLRRNAGLDVADLLPTSERRDGDAGIVASTSGIASSSIRIPGAAQSPPIRSRSVSKSSYSPNGGGPASAPFSPESGFSAPGSTSLSSASLSLAPSRSTSSVATTPSGSYTTPTVPASTPVHLHHQQYAMSSLTSEADSGTSTPFGSSTSSSSFGASTGKPASGAYRAPAYKVPPPSLASSLGTSSGGFPQLHHQSVGSPYALSTSPIPENVAECREDGRTGLREGSSQESLQRRLSSSRNGARVAETGLIPDRRGIQRTLSGRAQMDK